MVSMEEHDERISLLYYILAFLVIGLADLLYNQPLYDLTLKYVPLWQAQYQDTDFTIEALRAITYLGEGYAGALIFGLAFAFSTKDKAFYILLCHTVGSTINKNLKILYRNPRPYMVDSALHAFECSKSFGNPSGHSTLSACIYITVFLLVFHERDIVNHGPRNLGEPLLGGSYQRKPQVNKYLQWAKYVLGLMLTATIILSVGFSRVGLGVHSMNQVLYGWSYGAWVALFLFKFVRPRIREHINELPFHQEYL